ncbi:MAG: NUDIX hydrolase [Pyrinomonadaceae bacterium]|nr:NUDIX hydrolase [Pyrinomonadaceae bacterium]
MTRTLGPWVIKGTARVYQSPWIEVREDQVIRPDGKAGTFATVRMKPGVSVLALDADESVYLTSEFRYAIERESIEVVSGAIEEDENPLDAAKRELREELGCEAEEWVELGVVDPFTSIVNSPANLFLARRLNFTATERESTEIIETIKVKLLEAVQMVMDSRITHGPSCVLILKINHYLNAP